MQLLFLYRVKFVENARATKKYRERYRSVQYGSCEREPTRIAIAPAEVQTSYYISLHIGSFSMVERVVSGESHLQGTNVPSWDCSFELLVYGGIPFLLWTAVSNC